MDLAVYDLKLHKVRFIATIIGISLLFTIVLAMNGLYRGNIYEGLALIKATNPDLWVVERYRGGPFNEQSTMPEFYHYSVKAIPGVEKASSYISYAVERQIGGKSQHFSIVGYDVFGGLGGPQKIYAGRNIEHAHYEMVAHPKLGVHLGDTVPLGLHTYTVVGLTRESVDPQGILWPTCLCPMPRKCSSKKTMKKFAISENNCFAPFPARAIYLQLRRKNCSPSWSPTPTLLTPSW